MEPIWLPLELTRLLLDLCRILLERRIIFGALLAPSGANPAPLSGVDLALFGAEKRLLLELYRILLERDSTTEPSFLKADSSSSLELYWLPWSGGSPWSDSSLGAALAPSMGAELDLMLVNWPYLSQPNIGILIIYTT